MLQGSEATSGVVDSTGRRELTLRHRGCFSRPITCNSGIVADGTVTMNGSDIARCQIQEWYPRFRRVSFRTAIHALPEAFVKYLLEDGVFLPRSSEAMPARTVVTCPELQSEDYGSWGEGDEGSDGDGEEGKEPVVPGFPELERDVKASIARLGGAVFPKLNWSAPTDAAWISTGGTLRCRNFAEVQLLLKASDRAAHDLCHAFDGCEEGGAARERPEEVVLALRAWGDLRPEREFRAFVVGGLLVGICQREVTAFYPSLVGAGAHFERAIADFFCEHVRGRFEAERFAFDCYVKQSGAVRLVDFNPWAGSTNPLLFSWDELQQNHARISAESAREEETRAEAGAVGGIERDLEAATLCADADTSAGSFADRGEPASATAGVGYRVEVRIVTSAGLVQPGMRIGTGVPFDLVDRRNWEEFIRGEAAREEQRDQAAAGA